MIRKQIQEPTDFGALVKEARQKRGVTVDALAAELGCTRQSVCDIEASPNMRAETFLRVCTALGVSPVMILR